MSATKRTGPQKDADRLLVAKWLVEGVAYRDMADRLAEQREYRIAHVQLWHDAKVILEEWREQRVAQMSQYAALQLTKLDAVENEAWEAWRRSIGQHVVTTETTGQHPSTSEKIEELNGDPRYLMVIEKCIEQRTRLLGLEGTDLLTGDRGDDVVTFVHPKEIEAA